MTNSMKQATLLLGLLLALIGCAPVVKDGQPAVLDKSVLLESGESVGQTFVSRDRGLSGAEIFLMPAAAGSGRIDLHLREDPASSSDIATGTLSLLNVSSPGYYAFEFPPQSGSLNHYYYLQLNLEGDGRVRVATTAGDTYLDGALYDEGKPVDGQMSFRLHYDAVALALGLLGQAGSWLWAMVIALFLYVLPGWSLLVLLLPRSVSLRWPEKLGLAIGLSLALYPLLILWTVLLGLHLGPLYAWLPGLLALVFLLWHWRRLELPPLAHWREGARFSVAAPDLALVLVIVLIWFTRFWVIRSLNIPMWGDSYQHTVIVQLLADHGGLFNSWQPYADLQTFTYHFGFHAAAVVFHWVSGLDTPLATLWTGQILNALAVIALYPLAIRVGGNRWAGVGAVLLAGLLGTMPMFYTNWGRYTQLAGQAVLPAAICLGWAALEAKQRDWRLMSLAWITLGGLALTHYRILIFTVFFWVAFFLLSIGKGRLRITVARTTGLAIGAGLLFLPWFLHTFTGKIAQALATLVTTPVASTPVSVQEYNAAIGDISFYVPIYFWLLLPLCIGWGLWRRKKGVVLFSLWWVLVLLAANPQWFGLPGQGVLSNTAVFIALYIPVGVVVGSAFGWLANAPWVSRTKWGMALVFLVVTGIGLWGARQRLSDSRIAQSALVTGPDVRAAAWIRQNMPPHALFLVNSFFAYGDTLIVGSDGGWWLPLLARRRTMLPPLTYSNEQGPRPDYREWTNALSLEIKDKGVTSGDVISLLRERGITDVYIGQRQGRVNYSGADVLRPEQLLASANFRSIYHQDRVWVFQVVP